MIRDNVLSAVDCSAQAPARRSVDWQVVGAARRPAR
jgi:hypothetical protein